VYILPRCFLVKFDCIVPSTFYISCHQFFILKDKFCFVFEQLQLLHLLHTRNDQQIKYNLLFVLISKRRCFMFMSISLSFHLYFVLTFLVTRLQLSNLFKFILYLPRKITTPASSVSFFSIERFQFIKG